MYAEKRRSSDNMSARSSESDMSDVSALSRASSASHLSSTSYMSIQSERPGGRLRSALIWSYVQLKFYGCSYFIYSHPFTSSQSSFLVIILNVLTVFFPCMVITVCFSVLFLHANCCMLLFLCMLYLLCPCPHTNIRMCTMNGENPNKRNSDLSH